VFKLNARCSAIIFKKNSTLIMGRCIRGKQAVTRPFST
jgi:hypothetical protein